jgi:hypothetical protein
MNENKIWFQHNNLANKLRSALEAVINGQALHLTFSGLEDGECTVKVCHNGETCTFLAVSPRGNTHKKDASTKLLSVEEAVDPADLPDDPAVYLKPKKPRNIKAKAEPQQGYTAASTGAVLIPSTPQETEETAA